MRALPIVITLFVGPLAMAQGEAPASPAATTDEAATAEDVPLARRHYDLGCELYDRGRYREAATEFERAREIMGRPELDYNIGRTYERMGERTQAVEAYRRFLAARPDAPEAPSVRAAIEALSPHGAAAPVALTAATAPVRPRAWQAAVGVGASAIVLAAIGIGVYLAPHRDFRALAERCGDAGTCQPDEVASLRDRVRTAQGVGISLLALGGVAATIDIYLAVRAARARR